MTAARCPLCSAPPGHHFPGPHAERRVFTTVDYTPDRRVAARDIVEPCRCDVCADVFRDAA